MNGNGVDDSGQMTSSAPFAAASRVSVRYVLSIAPGVGVIPLLLLRNVPLNQRDLNRSSLVEQAVVLQASSAPHGHTDQHHSGHAHGDGRRERSRDDDIRECRAHQCDQRGHPEYADDARKLRDGQHRSLAVPEQQPRKAAPEVGAPELASSPRRPGQAESRGCRTARRAIRGTAQIIRETARDRRREAPRRRHQPAS